MKIEILRKNIQPGIISEEEWQNADILAQKYEIMHQYVKDHDNNPYASHLKAEDMVPQLLEAAHKIDKIAQDGDILIFVGNTPQLIRYPLEKMIQEKPNLKIVSLALSGHPGQVQERGSLNGVLKNILTEESHDAYKEYMNHMGLTVESIKGHKVHLVDCVGAGGGLNYLIKCISEIAYDGNMDAATQYVDVVATGPTHEKFS